MTKIAALSRVAAIAVIVPSAVMNAIAAIVAQAIPACPVSVVTVASNFREISVFVNIVIIAPSLTLINCRWPRLESCTSNECVYNGSNVIFFAINKKALYLFPPPFTYSIIMSVQQDKPETTLVVAAIPSHHEPAPPIHDSSTKLKPCCACPDTKRVRDECIFAKGEESCQELIEAHKACMRSYGFKV
ncbi:hypothetical protein G9A89_008294 [Geosiphon pyriformis]|nr:hypothetical protein G9A89_008294 [Geosiphon pyriformis]